MKLGIIGLPGSGKATTFEALTHNIQDIQNKAEDRIGTIRVPDQRVGILHQMYQPKKTIYAQVEYFLPSSAGQKKAKDNPAMIFNPVRDCDALIQVIRNFKTYGEEAPSPKKDYMTLEGEMILSDLLVVEKRLERLELDAKRGKKGTPEELALLAECKTCLEKDLPIRSHPDLAHSPLLRGFAFISGRPLLVLFNNMDEDNDPPVDASGIENAMVIRSKLEQELAKMSEEEAKEFLAEFGITESAMDRVILKSYDLQGMISFFTVGEDEVKAWTLKKSTPAVEAAGVIHSDIQQGFIRAEVLAYEDLMAAGSYAEARKKGTVRLEGKTYEVKDGDIINFRFNV
ncbi:MAG: redox-regulated ATPase YchF [Desulfobacteraceae bacterium]|nr:redox-regulated ATPase YchF [Desulfobacteraceae bacterium]MBU4001392.1 YchF family ATPase [Pseudomonadota bacterium]